jgi:hypothetical protein
MRNVVSTPNLQECSRVSDVHDQDGRAIAHYAARFERVQVAKTPDEGLMHSCE